MYSETLPSPETSRDNVEEIFIDGKRILLVGTAHVSRASVELVERVIREERPDSVAVELCEPRLQSLRDPDRWRNMDILAVLREGKAYVLLAQLILVGFQRKIGDALDIKPGAEMLRAVEVAEETGSRIVTADRDIRTTLKRTWSALSAWSMMKVCASLVGSLFVKNDITEEEIERLKSSVALDEMMKELSEKIPEVKCALIDERDQYLAAKIRSAPGEKIVAVVGAGHIPGIRRWITREVDLPALESLAPPGKLRALIGWSVPVLFVLLLIYGFVASGSQASADMAVAWAVITAFFSALGTLAALPHPLTLLSAAIAAPFTTLNPFIAVGWVAGLVEAYLRKPRVSDLERISEDMTTVRGVWSNRVSKVLLIMAFANLGGMIGTFVAIPIVASIL